VSRARPVKPYRRAVCSFFGQTATIVMVIAAGRAGYPRPPGL